MGVLHIHIIVRCGFFRACYRRDAAHGLHRQQMADSTAVRTQKQMTKPLAHGYCSAASHNCREHAIVQAWAIYSPPEAAILAILSPKIYRQLCGEQVPLRLAKQAFAPGTNWSSNGCTPSIAA
jgi:hypothetical protein